MNRRPITPAQLMRAGGLTIALVLLAAACGGDDSNNDEDTTTDTTAPATTEAPPPDDSDTTGPAEGGTGDLTPEEQVLADYEAAIDALEAAYAVPDPEHPDLLAHWSGDALRHLQADLENLELNGTAIEGTFGSDPVVELEPDGDSARVTNCLTDRFQRVDAETRDPIDDPGEEVTERTDRLEYADETWVIVENEHLEMDTCTPG